APGLAPWALPPATTAPCRRARAAYDQAPGLAPWALPPATTGALSAGEPSGIRARAPAPATPTPVELSVLRV
ncbi:2-oxoglutarate dehydrogenase, E2 component, dihydrolipoamide succinyltransferase, partial [Streptomyces cavourensis]|nr:2-oxoglutarate dehydrogenase, E2 component, dihydrolipoamide succinyltransferase [Streptomyces cavourensis]